MENGEPKINKRPTWFISKKKQRAIGIFLIIFLPLYLLASVYHIDAATPCSAGITVDARPAAHACCCCEDAAQCGCHMKETGSSKLPDPTIVSFSNLSEPPNKWLVFSQDIIVLSFTRIQSSGKTEELAQGPPVSIYLKTLNLLC